VDYVIDSTTLSRLDGPTLLFAQGLLGLLLAAVALTMGGVNPRGRVGLREWSAAMACAGTACLLFYLGGATLSGWVGVLPAFLLVASGLYAQRAYARLLGALRTYAFDALLLALGVSGVLAQCLVGSPARYGVLGTCVALTIAMAMSLELLLRPTRRRRPLVQQALTVLVALLAAGFVVQGLLVLAVPAQAEAGALWRGTCLTLAGMLALGSLGFFALVRERLRWETIESARRDSLTGLYTQAAFQEVALDIDRSGSAERYAIVMVDIDHLQTIGDSLGTGAHELLLAHVARLIANSVRISDFPVRHGSEEFCILLRNCGEADVAQFAHRLVEVARQQAVRITAGRSATVMLSAGYAYRAMSVRAGGTLETVNDVVERARRALEQARSGGRNQAVPAAPPA